MAIERGWLTASGGVVAEHSVSWPMQLVKDRSPNAAPATGAPTTADARQIPTTSGTSHAILRRTLRLSPRVDRICTPKAWRSQRQRTHEGGLCDRTVAE